MREVRFFSPRASGALEGAASCMVRDIPSPISYTRAAGPSIGSAQQYQGSVKYGIAARETRWGRSGKVCRSTSDQMRRKISCLEARLRSSC